MPLVIPPRLTSAEDRLRWLMRAKKLLIDDRNEWREANPDGDVRGWMAANFWPFHDEIRDAELALYDSGQVVLVDGIPHVGDRALPRDETYADTRFDADVELEREKTRARTEREERSR